MEKLGKYRIEAKLGEGAMGFVYKAWHPGFNDYVALKTIQNSASSSQLTEWFKFEARTLARLKHPNIVQIYEVEEDQGINFIVMEYLNGGSLDRLIERSEDVPLAKRVGYLVCVCQALDHAHRRKVFHRDIKPANIMLHHDGEDEIVKVVDFGIARLVDFAKTQANWQLGAPAYMAPELLTASSTANEKTDIWAVGVTLYELLAYHRPFRGDSLEELKRNVVSSEPPPLTQYCSECPADLEAITLRMLRKNPDQRYQSIEEVLLDLEPVAKRLRNEAATTFLRRAEELYELDDFDGARTTAKRALQYDSANTQARSLLQRALEEIRRKEVKPKLDEHFRKASDFLQIGQIEKARSEVNAALGLDSRFEPILKLRGQIEEAAARVQLMDLKIKATKQRLSEGSLTQAEALLNEAENLDLLNPQIKELRRQLEDERQRRERRKKLNVVLNRARTLLAEGNFDECLRALENGQKEFPTENELRKLQEIARAELAELERQRARDRTIAEVRKLIGGEQFQEALPKIQDLLQVNPNDVVVRNLETLAADGLREQEKRKRLEQNISEIRALIAAEDYKRAISRGETLMKEFPREYEIRELVDYATNELYQQDLKRRESQKETEILQFLERSLYDEAERAASAAVEEFPRSPIFRELVEEAKRQKRRRDEKKQRELEEKQRAALEQREALNRKISSIKALLSADDVPGAEGLLDRVLREHRVSETDSWIREVRAEITERKRRAVLLEQEKKHEFNQLFEEAATRLEKNDVIAATRFLEKIRKEDASGIDAQRTLRLESEIDSKKRALEVRRQEEQRAEEQKRAEHDRCLDEIHRSITEDRVEEASKSLASALKNGLVEGREPRVIQLQKDLEEKKRILQFKKEEEARGKIQAERDRLTKDIQRFVADGKVEEACRLLAGALSNGTLDEREPRVLQIRNDLEGKQRILQFKRDEEERRKANQEWVISRIKELIAKQELPEANQLLLETIANGILPESHEAARQLRGQIQEANLRARERDREERARLEGQDRCLNETRILTKSGDFAKATLLLDQAVGNGLFTADEERVRSMRATIEQEARLADIRRKEEERKLERQTARLNEVEALLRAAETANASAVLGRAIQDGILSIGDSRVVRLQGEIRQKEHQRKAQEEDQRKQQAQKLEQKRHYAREALTRGDYDSALRIAKEGLQEFGANSELAEVVGRAEAAIGKEEVEKRNRDELLQRITEHIDGGNVSAADLMLNNSLKNGALKTSDPQVAAMVDKLRTLVEQERKNRNELQQARSRIQELIKKRQFSEALTVGQNFLALHGFREEIADLVKKAELEKAAEEAFQKRRQAELETVRGLLSEGNPSEAKRLLEECIRQGILQQDSETKELSKKIDADLRTQAKERARQKGDATPVIPGPQPRRMPSLRVTLAIGVAMLLLAGSYGIYRVVAGKSSVAPPAEHPEPNWLQEAQADLAANPHQFHKADALLSQIIKSSGVQPEAKQQAIRLLQEVQSKIQNEDDLLNRGNQALLQRDCKNAASLFGQLIDVRGDHLDEAKVGQAKATDSSNCEADPSVLVKKTLGEADRAFSKQDWNSAKYLYELILTNPAASPSDIGLAKTRVQLADKHISDLARRKADAEAKTAEIELQRKEEEAVWSQANAAKLSAGQDRAKLEAAQTLFKKVASYGLTHKLQADQEIANIESLIAGIDKGEQERACGQNWLSLSADYNASVDNRDEKKLNTLKGSLEQFSRTSCAQADQARALSAKIPSIIAGWNPPPPPPKVEPEKSRTDPENNAIHNLIEVQLTEAFHQKDVKLILAIWPNPYFAKEDQRRLKESLDGSKEYSRNFRILKIEDRGVDEKEVSGSYSGEYVGRDGKRQLMNGNFDARVIHQNGRWIIKNITW